MTMGEPAAAKFFFKQLLFTLIATVILYLPTWIWLIFKFLLKPEGFWQNLVMFGLGVWFLGGIQVILFFTWLIVLAAIWKRD